MIQTTPTLSIILDLTTIATVLVYSIKVGIFTGEVRAGMKAHEKRLDKLEDRVQ